MPGALDSVRPECNVNRIIRNQQSWSLDMLLGVESNGLVALRFRSRYRRCDGHRTVYRFGAGGEIEGMKIECRRAILEVIGNHIQNAAPEIDCGRAENPHLG